MRQIALVITCLLYMSFLSAQSTKQAVWSMADKLADGREVHDASIGKKGTKTSNQYQLFTKLEAQASTEELITLLGEHQSSVVKAYAFKALTKRKDAPNLVELIKQSLDNKLKVHYLSGCVGSSHLLPDFLILEATPSLNKKDKAALNQLLLFTPNELIATNNLLRTLPTNDKYYTRLQEMVKEEDKIFAIRPLLKYKKTEDIAPILQSIDRWIFSDSNSFQEAREIRLAFDVIKQEFKHAEFFPTLVSWHKKYLTSKYNRKIYPISGELYDLIASYQNEDALAVLQELMEGAKNKEQISHYQRLVGDAVNRNPAKVYAPLLKLFGE